MSLELNEVERLKMENYALRILFMQQQLQQMQTERLAFIKLMEDVHPGYECSEAHGALLNTEVDDEAAYAIDSAKGR